LSEPKPFPWVFPYAEDPTSGRTHPTGRIVYRPVVNSAWTSAPWQVVLGQVGFFDQFTVSFSRRALRLAIEHVESFDERFGELAR
jgi:hypothetical protein